MKRDFFYISVDQPIGCFYIVSIIAEDLVGLVDVFRRDLDGNGNQRELDSTRVNEISQFCSDPDATFPTPIIISVNKEVNVVISEEERKIYLEFDDNAKIGSVLDGQHRLFGISKYDGDKQNIELPVVLMFDLTPEEEAYVFSIINSKQMKVNTSLIYDLFGLSSERSPQRTAHEIARLMNKTPESPFFDRMKMLGKKAPGQTDAFISQGSFVNALLKLICRGNEMGKRPSALKSMSHLPNMPFRDMYLQGRDDVIFKVLLNCFCALKEVFEEEWNNANENILWKTTGFGGVMKALPDLVELGQSSGVLNKEFFRSCFENFKNKLQEVEKDLYTDFKGGGEALQNAICDYIVSSNIVSLF